MSEVKIDMNTEEVEITMVDGEVIRGEVFLSMYSTNRMGSQTVDEFLCKGDQFIPMKTEEGSILINSQHIMMARVRISNRNDDLNMMGEKYRLRINTTIETTVEADVYVSLPKGYQRVKDFLNQSPQYLSCYTDEYTLLINKDFIISVLD